MVGTAILGSMPPVSAAKLVEAPSGGWRRGVVVGSSHRLSAPTGCRNKFLHHLCIWAKEGLPGNGTGWFPPVDGALALSGGSMASEWNCV